MSDTTTEATGQPETGDDKLNQPFFDDDSLLAEIESRITAPKQNAEPTDDEVDPEADDAPELTDDDPQENLEEDDAAPEPDDEPQVDGDLPIGVKKRIDKLTAKRREAEESAEAAKQELTELRKRLDQLEQQGNRPAEQAASKAPTHLQKVEQATTYDELEALQDEAEGVLDLADDNPDGLTLNEGSENETYIEPQQLRQYRKNARETLKAIREQRKLVKQMEAADAMAREVYPWMYQDDHPGKQLVAQLMEKVPELKRQPDHKILYADLLRGIQLRMQETQPQQEAVKPKPEAGQRETTRRAQPPKAPAVPKGNQPPLGKPRDDDSDLQQRVAQGDDEAIEQLLVRKLSRR